MDKCEWKNGKFEGCDEFTGMTDQKKYIAGNITNCCLYCQVDIRKPEPEPTHEKIMTKWWKAERHDYHTWLRIIRYDPNNKSYYISEHESRSKEWFKGCESADIPPDAE